ncbi:MAG: putative Ig domain-containing protein [Bacteroidia bacterium]|nr:putative Ig domain-containing protein [Bacteroidia bacterium]
MQTCFLSISQTKYQVYLLFFILIFPFSLPAVDLDKRWIDISVDPIANQCNTEGDMLAFMVNASGGDGALSYSATNLPPGIGINAATGEISGSVSNTAFTGLTYNCSVSVDDADGDPSDKITVNFDWDIYDSPIVVYRVNCGGPLISSIDGGMDWGKDERSSPSSYLSSGGSNTASIHGGMNSYEASVDLSTTPTDIYKSERWDLMGGSQIEYSFPLSDGVYELRVYIGNEDNSTSTPGTRVFDISVEGSVPTLFKDIDLSGKFGHRVGGVFIYPIIINDGSMEIKLINNIVNPLINGIEIISGDSCNLPALYPIAITPFPDQYNEEGQSINLKVTASGGDGPLVYSATGLPPGLSINSSSGLISGTISNTAAVGSPFAVSLSVDDNNLADVNTETSNFSWNIFPSGTAVIDAWTLLEPQISPSHTGRHENSFVKAGNRFYLFGGRESPLLVEAYDFINRSWAQASTPAPYELNHFQPVIQGGYIWVLGAFDDNNFPNESAADSVFIYDPRADAWFSGPEIPIARRRGSAGAVVYDEKIYLIGGNANGHDGGYVAWFDEFDPATGTWTSLTDAPRARDHFQAVIIGSKLYLASGRLSGGPGGVTAPMISEVDVYDFNSSSWSTLAASSNLPTERAGAAAVNFKGNLVVIGGEGNGQAWSTVESLDPATNIWQSLDPLNAARHGTQAIVAGDGIFITSGSPLQGSGNMTNMEVYSKENPPAEAAFTQGQLLSPDLSLSLMPVSIGNSSTTKGKIYNTGGTQGILLMEIDLQANPLEYELIHNLNFPVLLGVDDTAEFTVKYTPQSANPIQGSLVVSHNGSNPALTFTLSGTALPVEWLSFVAEEIGGDAVINWSTARELNNQYFSIERSVDGRVFQEVGRIEGAGNSTELQSYEYIDKDILSYGVDRFLYRLKQVDFDGQYNFSQSLELKLGIPLISYPVPFKDELFIRYQTERFSDPGIRIINSLGQLMFEASNLDGKAYLELDTSDWPGGIYFVQLLARGNKQVFKVLKEEEK